MQGLKTRLLNVAATCLAISQLVGYAAALKYDGCHQDVADRGVGAGRNEWGVLRMLKTVTRPAYAVSNFDAP